MKFLKKIFVNNTFIDYGLNHIVFISDKCYSQQIRY